jgi:hypothetical protein
MLPQPSHAIKGLPLEMGMMGMKKRLMYWSVRFKKS